MSGFAYGNYGTAFTNEMLRLLKEDSDMASFKRYLRTAIAEMADWYPGFDMTGVSVSVPDREAGSPKEGDKIARNPRNHDDKWLVSAEYFADNFVPMDEEPRPEAVEIKGKRGIYFGIPGHCYDIDGNLWHGAGECGEVECRSKPCCGYRPFHTSQGESDEG